MDSGTGGDEPARPRLTTQLLLGLVVFGLYSVVSSFDEHRQAAADRHGRAIFDAERFLHVDAEPALNRALAPHPVLCTLANYEYASTYVLAAFGLLAWLYLRRPAQYRWARNTFVVLNLLGIGCFALYPVTPPRLLAELGFVDTVRLHHTWGSWGSPLVTHGNQLAAMPSLHIAWAMWVSVVLARLSSARIVQLFSAVHVLGTLLVIMATANHYLLDAVAGAVAVPLAVALARTRGRALVPAADAFFLHVETPAAAQHVGGLALLDTSGTTFTRDELAATVREHLPELPRFRQRVAQPSRWQRARWVDHPELDWDWHVPQRDLTGPDGQPGGASALNALVAELAGERLPRDRPLWRFIAVSGVAPGRSAAILIVHHVIADGLGTVAQAMTMLKPIGPGQHDDDELTAAADRRRPGLARRVFGTGLGLAQLAVDGRPSTRLPSGGRAERGFGTVTLPLDQVRAVAHANGTRVSDVLLASVAGGLRRALGDAAPGDAAQLRVAVPLMVREPGSAAEGNLTAAVMTNVPLGPLGATERLAEVASRSRVLHTGTRALASTFVMRQVGGLMPAPLHAWFARTVYGGAYFQGIVSNMPGPQVRLSLAGAPLDGVYPVLPLAPGAPLGVGALGWDGELFVGVCVDPALVADAAGLAAAVGAAFAELRDSTDGRDNKDSTDGSDNKDGQARPAPATAPEPTPTPAVAPKQDAGLGVGRRALWRRPA